MARINYLRVGPTVATYVRVGDIFGSKEDDVADKIVLEVTKNKICTAKTDYRVRHTEEHEGAPKDCCPIYVGDSIGKNSVVEIVPNSLEEFTDDIKIGTTVYSIVHRRNK